MSLIVVILSGWLIVARLMDLFQRRVRWWWSLLGLLASLVYRLVVWIGDGFIPEQALIIILVVTLSYGIWRLGWWGGADAKTAMTLIIAIATLIFLGVFALLTLLISGLMIIRRRRSQALGEVIRKSIQVVRERGQEGERLPLVTVMSVAVFVHVIIAPFIL